MGHLLTPAAVYQMILWRSQYKQVGQIEGTFTQSVGVSIEKIGRM